MTLITRLKTPEIYIVAADSIKISKYESRSGKIPFYAYDKTSKIVVTGDFSIAMFNNYSKKAFNLLRSGNNYTNIGNLIFDIHKEIAKNQKLEQMTILF